MQQENKFEPATVNRWIMVIDDIHPFLVHAVKLPSIGPQGDRHITVGMHDSLRDGPNASLFRWSRDGGRRSAVLKFLDESGVVCETWKMELEPLKISFSRRDYANVGPAITTLDALCVVNSIEEV